ncbi:MAG: hypothetical protein ACERIH_11675 [Labilibaculum antarcticum]
MKFASSIKLVFPVVIFLICWALPQVQAQSFSVSPIKMTLKPQQNHSQQWLTVKTTGNKPVAVELSILKREVDVDGRMFHGKDDTNNDFLIYPSQLILMPGDAQTVNIQWLGEIPTNEIIYSLVVAQVPIEINQEENTDTGTKVKIKLLTKYEGIIYIIPNAISFEVLVESATQGMDANQSPYLELMLYNKGTIRQMINKLKLHVVPLDKNGEPVGESIVYMPEMPKEVIKQSLYAKQRRRCLLPWPNGVPVGPVKVSVENR